MRSAASAGGQPLPHPLLDLVPGVEAAAARHSAGDPPVCYRVCVPPPKGSQQQAGRELELVLDPPF